MKYRSKYLLALSLLAAGTLGCGDEDAGPTCTAVLTDGTCVGVDRVSTCTHTFCTEGVQCKSTYHVMSGGSGDGSAAAPFGKLEDAAAKAGAGDCIAVAAGNYAGVSLKGGVSLLGAGADMTTIQAKVSKAGVFIQDGSGGSLRGFTVSGPGYGIALNKVTGMTLTQLRLMGQRPSALDVRQSTGIKISQVEIQVVHADKAVGGVGLLLREGSSATVDRAYIEGCDGQGVMAHESQLVMTTSLVEKSSKYGLVIQCTKDAKCQSTLASSLDRVELKRSAGIGLLVIGASLKAQRLDIGHTTLLNQIGRGVELQAKASVELSDSLIHDSTSQGILVMGSTGKVQGTTVARSAERGIWVQDIASGTLELSNNTVTGAAWAGIGLTKAKGVTITGCSVSGVKETMVLTPTGADDVGDGLQILDSSEATVQDVSISGADRVGLLVDSAKATVKDSTITGKDGALLVQKSTISSTDYSNNKDAQGNVLKPTKPAKDLLINAKPLPGTGPIPLP